ncbi:MAG: glycosyltransferase [Candidatus Bathyarchaeia archaeon]
MGGTTFSVIIPTLNEEENLKICFRSLMEQTYRDFEVIIVDGGSKDRTVEMAERNGFDIIEVEKTRPHDVSAAKNEGARHARGEFLFFLDADMALDPNCFEVLKEGYGEPEVVGIACKVLPLEGNGLETAMYQCNNVLTRMANRLGVHELSYFSCRSYRKDCFEKVGGFREDLLACEDLDLSLRLRHLGRYIVTHRTTFWTSPRRLREWSYSGYLLRYLKYLAEYYLTGQVADFYEDL